MQFLKNELAWIRAPKQSAITENAVEIITEPNTDLWQRTYYGFQNDNAPILQMKTDEKYFFSRSKRRSKASVALTNAVWQCI